MHYLYRCIGILKVFIYVYGQLSVIKNVYYYIMTPACLGVYKHYVTVYDIEDNIFITLLLLIMVNLIAGNNNIESNE